MSYISFIYQANEVDLETTLQLVSDVSVAVELHTDKDILIDFRRTNGTHDFADLIKVINAFSQKLSKFENRIALIVPDAEKNMKRADFFKSGIGSRGFQCKFFTELEQATNWLSDANGNSSFSA